MSGQTDQSRPVSRVSVVEALTQIRALCDQLTRENAYAEDGVFAGVMHAVSRVRAVLDAVSVDATPAQGIDRDALLRLIDDWIDVSEFDVEALADGIVALVVGGEGVVLSREEAVCAASACHYAAAHAAFAAPEAEGLMLALAARLEVS